MHTTLENAHLQISSDPDKGSWNVRVKQRAHVGLHGLTSKVTYRISSRRYHRKLDGEATDLYTANIQHLLHGSLRQVKMDYPPDSSDLRFTLTFALSETDPLLLWKIKIENSGHQPAYIERLEMLRASAPRAAIQLGRAGDTRANTLAFFSNGWQSWSSSGAYLPGDRFRRTRLGPFYRPLRVNRGTPQPIQRGRFASDMFAVLGDRETRTAVLLGFLSQRQHFGSITANLNPRRSELAMWANGDRTRLDPGAHIETDWACLYFLNVDDPDPLAPYLQAVAREHHIQEQAALGRSLAGWCSWYYYFQDISAQVIRSNLAAAIQMRSDLPLEVFQIDDGFETQIGDWYTFKESFPEGLAPLAGEIRQAGYVPGLWLAPFIVHPKSQLADAHPDWLLRNRFGRPVNAGFIWDAFTTALDLTHPGAHDYAREVVHKAAHEWGFSYLKLDFLYAAALPGRRHDPTKTRAQILRASLQTLREAAGENTTLLGCGCPLGPAIGLVDAMRIGADVDGNWAPRYRGIKFFFSAEPDMPATRNALQNILTRAPLHRRWWVNDPDCLLLHPESGLSIAETQTLATAIALSGGSLFISAPLPDLPPALRRSAEILLPLIGKTPRILDWLDSPTPRRTRLDLRNATGPWHLLSLFNWQEQETDLYLCLDDYGLFPEQPYWLHDFWGERSAYLPSGAKFRTRVPAHGVCLWAVRPVTTDHPQYIGSNLHISQGLEVIDWEWQPGLWDAPDTGLLQCALKRPGKANGYIDLSLPGPPQRALQDGRPLEWQALESSIYRFPVIFAGQTQLEIFV